MGRSLENTKVAVAALVVAVTALLAWWTLSTGRQASEQRRHRVAVARDMAKLLELVTSPSARDERLRQLIAEEPEVAHAGLWSFGKCRDNTELVASATRPDRGALPDGPSTDQLLAAVASPAATTLDDRASTTISPVTAPGTRRELLVLGWAPRGGIGSVAVLESIAPLLPGHGWLLVLGALAAGFGSSLLLVRATTKPDERAAEESRGLRAEARRREQALADLTHELRTPLTTILASIDMLRDGYADDPEDVRMFMDQASAAGHHLLFLVNDMLDSAAHDSGALRVDPEDLWVDDMLAKIGQVMGPVALVRGTELRIERRDLDGVQVHADANRVLQIAFNLVSNAIKFSPGGSLVTLSTRLEEGGERVRFEVRDEGIGVPSHRRDRLFTRYSRVHDSDASTASGTGLGLYVCRVLVERMGGDIGHRSPRDRSGSVFWFSLPTTLTATPQSSEPAPSDRSEPAPR